MNWPTAIVMVTINVVALVVVMFIVGTATGRKK